MLYREADSLGRGRLIPVYRLHPCVALKKNYKRISIVPVKVPVPGKEKLKRILVLPMLHGTLGLED